MPLPILREPGQYQEEEVKSPKPSITKLASQVKKLRKENKELSDQNAELKVELAKLRHDCNTFRRGMCAKIKHAFSEMGKRNIFAS